MRRPVVIFVHNVKIVAQCGAWLLGAAIQLIPVPLEENKHAT